MWPSHMLLNMTCLKLRMEYPKGILYPHWCLPLPGQQRVVELPIEHGGLGFLPVKDLAAIAWLSALASLPENSDTHSFREAVINKEGLDLETRLQPKMETPPKDIVGNVHVLPAGRSAKAISTHLTKSYLAKRVLRMPGCVLTTLSRSSNIAGCVMSTNTPSKRD